MSFLFPKIQQELQKIGLILDRRSILKAIQQQEMIAKQRERLLASKALDEAVRQMYVYESQVGRNEETVEVMNHCWTLQQSVIGSLYSKEGQKEILQRLQILQKKRNYRRKQWDVKYANQ